MGVLFCLLQPWYQKPHTAEGIKPACLPLYAKGDSAGFSDCLSQCYCHILSIVRSYMIRGGLNEAKKIIIPYDTEESV